jgi:ribosomal protein S18 acetylase RimI-like enzyme
MLDTPSDRDTIRRTGVMRPLHGSELVVRALRPGDRLAALRPVWGAPLVCGGTPIAHDALVVEDSIDNTIAALALCRRTSSGRRIEALHVGATAAACALAALADALAAERLELLVEADTREEADALDTAAAAAGLAPVLRQDAYRGSLDRVKRPAWRPFTFRRYEDLGRGGMLTILNACWGIARGPSGKRHEHELDDFLALAAGAGEPDVSLWRVAYHGSELAGIALGLREPAQPLLGRLLYLGLLPWARGRGLGRALYDEALWLLRSAGARRYRDATDIENEPMRRLLCHAGFERAGASTLYARDGRITEPRAAKSTAATPIPCAPRSLLRVPMNTVVSVRDIH